MIRALFVDRDGTVIRERGYLADPAGVELLPGAVEGLAALERAGYRIVIVTNQSGIARGLYDLADFEAVQQRVEDLLADRGVTVLGSYHCPHHPEYTGPCACRKPAPGLYRQAAAEHGLELATSVWVGDRLRDVETAGLFGGLAVLVRTGYGADEARRMPDGVVVADHLADAADLILRAPGFGSRGRLTDR